MHILWESTNSLSSLNIHFSFAVKSIADNDLLHHFYSQNTAEFVMKNSLKQICRYFNSINDEFADMIKFL